MIRVENIKKTFNPHSKNKNQVLKGVSFELPDSGFVAIYGKSGSGKTTMLSIMGGLEKADSGKIYIDNVDVTNKLDHIRNEYIGFIFQNYYLEKGYTIEEIMINAMHIAGFSNNEEIKRRCNEVLEIVDLKRFKNKPADQLSGGQKQRVAIARALIKGSKIILADEPTGNLDSENTYKVMNILHEISKTRLVVLVTHEVSLIKEYADSYIKFQDGNLIPNAEIDECEFASMTYDNSKVLNVDATSLVSFTPSNNKKNGRLYHLKNIISNLRKDNDEKLYSTANIFKMLFIIAMSIVVAFFSLFTFDVIRANSEQKKFNDSSIYTSMSSYSEIRKLDKSLYDSIDFYRVGYQTGVFSYSNLQSLSSIELDYTPRAIKKDIKLEYGKMPSSNEVLVTRKLANELKNKVRIKELENDESLMLMYFEKKYQITGIVEGNSPLVYMNQADYVNFLGIYQEVYITDNTNLFFKSDFMDSEAYHTINSYSAEICVYEGATIDLNNEQSVIELNRNSIYKMMNDISSADYVMEKANKILIDSPEYMYITNSYPLYIRKLELTRTPMTTDIRIYVTQEAMNNIFSYIEPNLDALGSDTSYYFEINTSSNEQLKGLKQRLNDRGILSVDIASEYNQIKNDSLKEAMTNIYIFILIAFLMYCVYYFIEKSGSIKNSKEYGIYRAIGVRKSNLLFKETMNTLLNNIVIYLFAFIIEIIFISIRYHIMNVSVIGFVGISCVFFFVSSIIMVLISLIPYLFVLYKEPSEILSSYDI